MRYFLRSFLVLALPLSILAACGTDREPGSPVDTSLDLTGVAQFCPSGDISVDIAAIFPTASRLRHVATVNCGQVFSDFDKGKQTESVEKAFAFFLKSLQQNEAGQLLVSGAEGEADIVELFTLILTGIGVDLPDMDPEDLADALTNGEYAVGTLFPDGPPLLTASLHAGIGDPGGGLSGPVTAVIIMIPADESELDLASLSHPCPAGVVNSFDCYPLFYDYSVSPVENVTAVGLQLGQCNVSPSGVEVELLSPEGFLPLDDAPTGIDCSDVVAEPEVTMTGWRSYAWSVLEPVAPLLRVTPAFAGQSPIGGRISNFSPVAPADPSSGEPALTGTSTELTPNDASMTTSSGDGDTQLFSAAVTDLETEGGVSEGTVTFTVTGGEFLETVVVDVVEGAAFMDVGCNTESYGDVMVPFGEFTVDADYSGTENYAASSEPEASSLTCSEIVIG